MVFAKKLVLLQAIMKKVIKKCFLLLLLLAFTVTSAIAETPNERQARRMFDQTYNMVFGEQGSTLHYAVNIIGVYKTEGTIWYKGKKSKFIDERYNAYCDGVNYWLANRKKKTVTVFAANDDKRDKYATKFTFEADNYHYHIADTKEGYAITLKAKRGAKGIKEVRAMIDKKTRHPKSLRIKLGIFHTTIRIFNFKSGGIDDQLFVFPSVKYQGFEMIDKRS